MRDAKLRRIFILPRGKHAKRVVIAAARPSADLSHVDIYQLSCEINRRASNDALDATIEFLSYMVALRARDASTITRFNLAEKVRDCADQVEEGMLLGQRTSPHNMLRRYMCERDLRRGEGE
jgi:hypothetical protein